MEIYAERNPTLFGNCDGYRTTESVRIYEKRWVTLHHSLNQTIGTIRIAYKILRAFHNLRSTQPTKAASQHISNQNNPRNPTYKAYFSVGESSLTRKSAVRSVDSVTALVGRLSLLQTISSRRRGIPASTISSQCRLGFAVGSTKPNPLSSFPYLNRAIAPCSTNSARA